MLDIVHPEYNLLITIEKIVGKITNATTSAEVLEYKDQALLIYDIVKRSIRIEKKKEAHDDIIIKFKQAQGDLVLGILRADARLAAEYDLAKKHGEVAKEQKISGISERSDMPPTQCDLGIDPKRLSEARRFDFFDRTNPGKVEEFVKEIIEEGEEPTKFALSEKVREFNKPIENIIENKLLEFDNRVICPHCGYSFNYRSVK